MKGLNDCYGRATNIIDTIGIVDDTANGLARETLRLPPETAANSRGNDDALFGRTRPCGLARLAALGRSRRGHLAARGQQTPSFHLFWPAISPFPSKDTRSGTQ